MSASDASGAESATLPADVDPDAELGDEEAAGLARGVLEYLARELVDDADAVRVDVDEDRRGVTLRLSVAPGDMGKVIGRRGRVAQAIRTVVRAAGAREGLDVTVDIVD